MAYVWQISVMQFEEKCIISGTILSGLVKQKKTAYKLNNIPSSYFQKPLANHTINIQVDKKQFYVSTDEHGGFTIELDNNDLAEIKIFSDEMELQLHELTL